MQIKSRSSPAAPSAASIPVSQRTYLPYSLFLYTTSCSSAGHVTHQQLPSDRRAIGCDRLGLLPHVAASHGHCCPPDFYYEINQPDISWLIHPLSPVSRTFPSRDPDRGAAAPSHCLRRRSERPRSRAPPPPTRTEVASPPRCREAAAPPSPAQIRQVLRLSQRRALHPCLFLALTSQRCDALPRSPSASRP